MGRARVRINRSTEATGETLAGRIAYLEMHPIDGLEVPEMDINALWVRGGFPDSFLAASDRASHR